MQPRALAPELARNLTAVRDAVRDVPFSREALRAAVVRAAASARDGGSSAREVTDALEMALAPTLAGFPHAIAAELRVHVAWWAAHGYHRAD